MTNIIGVSDAKTHLPQHLERVAKGERITITKRGVAVAMLVPPSSTEAPDVDQVIADLIHYFKTHGRTLRGLTIRELIEAGRRY